MNKLFAAVLLIGSAAVDAQVMRRPVQNGVIDQSGSYVLTRSAAARAGAVGIVITANDVTLDMSGFHLEGPGGKSGTGVLIRGAKGVRLHNGSISNFAFGVVVENSSNVIITRLRIRAEGLPVVSPPPETGVMIVGSANVVVEDNAIHNVGLGIFVRGGASTGNRISQNTVTAGSNGVLGICYNPSDTDMNGPRGDLVYGNLVSGFNTGVQFSSTSRRNVLRGNTIVYRTTAVEDVSGLNIDVGNDKVALP